jgi:hypothetical protein
MPSKRNPPLPENHPGPTLLLIRGQRVVLDSELARLYGVNTKQFNQAFKRNEARFPPDFAFKLTTEEASDLRSHFVTSSFPSGTGITPSNYGGRRHLPWVFTEHGAVMAANILRGDRAVKMSVFVVRAFVRMREQIAVKPSILDRLHEIDEKLLDHDEALRDVYEKLLFLLDPPPDAAPKRPLGLRKTTE